VQLKLKDLFINAWYSQIENSSKGSTYRIFKQTFQFERYLTSTPYGYLTYMLKFRTRNHRLPIETGNWSKTPLNLRVCNLCNNDNNNNYIGDEFHYLFQCKSFEDERKLYLKPYYYRRPNTYKMEKLLNHINGAQYIKLCKFIKKIMLSVK
jgi:hypothetical protein